MSAPPAFTRQRAVVIDDSSSALTMMIRLLEGVEGCDPIGFTDSAQGLAWCLANEFDLLVVDYQMPSPNGLMIIEAVRAAGRDATIPVVMVTSTEELDIRYMALQLGATDFLSKPVDPVEFAARMRNMLVAYRAHRTLAEVSQWLTDEVRKASLVLRQSPSSVVITDARGIIEYVNPKFCETSGYQPEEVMGQRPSLLKSGFSPPEFYRDLWETVTAGHEWCGTFQNRRKDGSLYWESAVISALRDRDGTITNFVAIKEDITLRKEYEARLEWQANYDALTGLPNRMLLLDRLTQAIGHAVRLQGRVTVMMVDILRFKAVNDTLGHDAGDDVLREAAARLKSCVGQADTVARLGNADFAVVLCDLGPGATPETMAARICDRLGTPFSLAGTEVFISARIGIALFPEDGENAQMLLRSAAAAVPAGEGEGGREWRFFTAELDNHARRHQAVEANLRHALGRGELRLVYHPLVDVRTGRAGGAEALLRWTCPELGQIPPDQFIPIAEATGLIVPIGAWVIETVCRDMAAWRAEGVAVGKVAVNVSSRQLTDRSLLDIIGRSLREHGIASDRLEIEVTERLLLDTSSHTMALLNDLRAMGLRFSIDDFGTGYSAMSYLTSFPFDVLKVDRSFVSRVTERPQDAALTQAIVAMAHSLDMEVVAEGVETAAQLEFLRDCRCNYAQGFLFARPLAAEEFALFLRSEA